MSFGEVLMLIGGSMVVVPVTAFFVVKFSVYAYYCGLELYDKRRARNHQRESENDGKRA